MLRGNTILFFVHHHCSILPVHTFRTACFKASFYHRRECKPSNGSLSHIEHLQLQYQQQGKDKTAESPLYLNVAFLWNHFVEQTKKTLPSTLRFCQIWTERRSGSGEALRSRKLTFSLWAVLPHPPFYSSCLVSITRLSLSSLLFSIYLVVSFFPIFPF